MRFCVLFLIGKKKNEQIKLADVKISKEDVQLENMYLNFKGKEQ